MIKPVYINENDAEAFNKRVEEIHEHTGMSYSEFVRAVVLNSELQDTASLSSFYAKESRKSAAKYVIVAIRKK